MKPHKHAELIKAWADGAEIQIYCRTRGWNDLGENPIFWYEDEEYRIKPEPKPDVVAVGIGEWNGTLTNNRAEYQTRFRPREHWEKNNLKLTFDSETGELKSAEVLK